MLLVTVKDGKIYNIDQQKKAKIDDATKTGTQEMLFGFIAQSLIDFIKEHNITEKLPLGFTFSFPVHQTSLISGTLIHWTKNFDAKGAVNEDVVRLLKEALKKNGVGCHWAVNMISGMSYHTLKWGIISTTTCSFVKQMSDNSFLTFKSHFAPSLFKEMVFVFCGW